MSVKERTKVMKIAKIKFKNVYNIDAASSLSKYKVSLGEKAPSASNLLVPPHASNQRRHSIGERLAAALHIGQSPEAKWKGHHKDSF